MTCGAPRVPEQGFHRACVRRALASLSTMAMMFLQREGANPAGRPLSSMAWSRALCAADSWSRISPLSFDGDKRGRMRQFYEAVVFDRKFFLVRCIPPCAGRSSCDSVSWSRNTTSSACPLVADPASMPRKAAVVPLDDWLPSNVWSVLGAIQSCEVSGSPVAPRSFDVNMGEWRALCRRMLRSGLGKKVHPTSSLSHLSGGAFAVPEDFDRDRFIGDRRPRNGTERLIEKCHLPWVPRHRRLMLPFIFVMFLIVTTLIV